MRLETDLPGGGGDVTGPLNAIVPSAMASGEASPDHVAMCTRPADLTAIHRRDINLAIWTRQVPVALKSFLDRCEPEKLPALDAVLTRSEASKAIAYAVAAGMPALGTGQSLLIRDLARLVAVFFTVTGSPRVDFRLEPVTTDACRLFHHDAKSVRLLCTYRGLGTEWLPNDAADRAAIGCGDNGLIVSDPAAVRRLDRFVVGLFKGERYPGNRGNGIIHRSPPVTITCGPRLLLRLDEAE